MKRKELEEVLRLHKMWIKGEKGGVIANLTEADLERANLRGAILGRADLTKADLRGANLRVADLERAKMPMYCKWTHSIIDDKIQIGCEIKTIEEWDSFFASNEIIKTPRGTNDFLQIHAVYDACKAYLNRLKTKEK